mmetsp:Transcript_10319/g.12946  ORF Transcript_10319/g.12946 Transcript_10319/m.12946 type:complete len:332 (-) Transcript_10319:239-1234(-)
MGRVNLRIFTHSKSCDKGHSLLVCNDQGGLTDKVGGIRIQDNKTTFQDLRLLIEEVEIGGMRRRTAFYPEILFTMMNAPNPHGYSSSELRHYQFGLVEKIKALQGKRKESAKGKNANGNKKNKKKIQKDTTKQTQEKQTQEVPPVDQKSLELKPKPPPLPDLQENLMFGSLKLPASNKEKKEKGEKKRKNLHKLLEKAEAKRQRLEELKQTEEGKKQAEQEEWGDMLKQASGKKIHDNTQQIKKAIKKREKKKEKSRKKWKERETAVKQSISAKQEKREKNLAKRKNKGKGAVPTEDEDGKPHSRRAGFEGKKTDFINKAKQGAKTNKTDD